MPLVLVTTLRYHRIRQLEERLAAGERWSDWGLVFTTTTGTPLDGTNVTKRLQATLAATGLPKQRFHDLRHCCASLLLAQGVPLRVAMEILGHSQIRLSLDTYSHVMTAAQREAASLMDEILTSRA